MPVIDIHTHGIAGYDTKGATPQDILRIAEIHGSLGTDAIIPAIYSASIDEMRRDIGAVQKAMEMQRSGVGGRKSGVRETSGQGIGDAEPAEILGVNLEGPFLNPDRAGALDRKSFLPPKIAHFQRLIEGFTDIMKLITVAPELEGAPDLIRFATDSGVIASMGHSDASYEETRAGFNAGAKGITHIFNAMRGIHHREPGIAGFGLTDPNIYIEIIADPFHLHHKTKEMIFRIKDPTKIIIVSDTVKSTGVHGEGLAATDATGRLLGGSLTVAGSAQYLTSLGFQRDIVEGCINTNPQQYLAL